MEPVSVAWSVWGDPRCFRSGGSLAASAARRLNGRVATRVQGAVWMVFSGARLNGLHSWSPSPPGLHLGGCARRWHSSARGAAGLVWPSLVFRQWQGRGRLEVCCEGSETCTLDAGKHVFSTGRGCTFGGDWGTKHVTSQRQCALCIAN